MINGLPESRGVTAPLHSDACYQAVAANFAATIAAFWWAKGQWRWFRCYPLMFWIAMNNLLPEFLISPGQNNFATMNPTANIVCSGLALAANVALFTYWLYVVTIKRRNPVTTGIFQELAEYCTIAKEHFTDADKYWIVDMIPETPAQLGLEPDSDTPPADGFVTRMPWWGKETNAIRNCAPPSVPTRYWSPRACNPTRNGMSPPLRKPRSPNLRRRPEDRSSFTRAVR